MWIEESSRIPLGTAGLRGATSGEGKHMALKANWMAPTFQGDSLLISGFTSKLYFYRYAPMQLNVALLRR